MYVGLAHAVVAKLNVADDTYSEKVVLGEAIGLDIEPQYKEAEKYGDNKQISKRKRFKNAKVSLETSTIPLAGQTTLFGHKTDTSKQEIVYNVNDNNNYVGLGVYVTEEVDGVDKYSAMFMYKVKFAEGKEAYETEGDSITYQTPSIDGEALGNTAGNWRKRKQFDTEAAAIAWIDSMIAGTEAASK